MNSQRVAQACLASSGCSMSQNELCYTGRMMSRQDEWQIWAQKLQRWNLNEPAAALLEGAGPLNIIFAQFLHFSQPILGRIMPSGHYESLARLLEEEDESRLFAAFLRQEDGK